VLPFCAEARRLIAASALPFVEGFYEVSKCEADLATALRIFGQTAFHGCGTSVRFREVASYKRTGGNPPNPDVEWTDGSRPNYALRAAPRHFEKRSCVRSEGSRIGEPSPENACSA
jgi:hypothetical protein